MSDELIARLEAATGPTYALDRDIRNAVHPSEALALGRDFPPPAYTASVDTALTLVPEGHGIETQRYWLADGVRWRVLLCWGLFGENAEAKDVPTYPLALCIASLKARNSWKENPSNN